MLTLQIALLYKDASLSNLSFVVYADINECLEDNGGCNQFCNNTNDGSYFCTCKDGYLLDVDDKGCLRKFLMFVCL